MEKRLVLSGMTLILRILLVLFSFGVGTLSFSTYIGDEKSISFLDGFGLPILVAAVFLVSYFINVLVWPPQPSTTKISCLYAALLLIWGASIFTFSVLVMLNRGHPIRYLWSGMFLYSMTGWLLAEVSSRVRAIFKKIES